MRRIWGPVVAGLALLGGSGAVVSACAHDDSTIFVLDVLAPKLVTQGQQCLFTPDPTQPFISNGTLDVALSQTYDAMFLVGNQMVPRGDPTSPKTETSYVTIQGAVVRITDAQGGPIASYTRFASGTIPPSQGGVPSFVPIDVTILDPDASRRFIQPLKTATTPTSTRVITYTKFFGQTLGGQSVESDEFSYPIDLCYSCLIAYDTNPGFPGPNCVGALTGSASPTQTQVPCFLGQDAVISCSACLGLDVCLGPVDAGIFLSDGGIADAGGGG